MCDRFSISAAVNAMRKKRDVKIKEGRDKGIYIFAVSKFVPYITVSFQTFTVVERSCSKQICTICREMPVLKSEGLYYMMLQISMCGRSLASCSYYARASLKPSP
jgi:hypothetical protein